MNLEVFLSVIVTAVGAGTLVWSAWLAFLALASRRWPQAEGKIIVSDLQRSKGSEGGYMYRSEVSYVYTVAGQELVGSRTRFGDRMELSWSAPALRVVQQYKAGSRVTVRYDPNDPEECVLESGINGFVFLVAATGAVVLTVGVAWLRSSW